MIDFDNLGKQLTSLFDSVDKYEQALKKWRILSEEQRLQYIKTLSEDRRVFQLVWSSMTDIKKTEFMSGINFPIAGMWKTKSFDIPVVITGISGIHDGVVYYSIQDSSSSVPQTELIF